MADTAQLPGAAETEVVSKEDAIAAAADAFKTYDAGPERELPQRGPDGKFTSSSEEEIEAETGADEAEATAESHEEAEEGPEAAEEAQPAADLPDSWPADKAELWETLDPNAQAYIRQRDAEQTTAVNAKFMEAANLRRSHEAEINEAMGSRQRYAEAVDEVLSLVVPRMPPHSMLDYNSNDYDPDQYHLRKAQYEETTAFLQQHANQRRMIAAQETQQQFNAINGATRDAFISLVPEVVDQAKAPTVFAKLMEYAVSQGAPPDLFNTPTTALEWTVLEKARRWDELQGAKARVAGTPKPEPRKAQPAVRPGVATSRSSIENQRTGKAMDRLRREGSVEAGAAALKHLLRGKLS